ncbi:MAG: asparagine--tRNA ligase [Eubacteriales bacterium]
MKRDLVKHIWADPSEYADRAVSVCGWARSIRDSKAFGFIDLYDGSCFQTVQVVFERDTISRYDEIARLNVGSALVVKGRVVLTPTMKQPFEIKATAIEIEGTSTPDYPLQKKRHTLEFLREQAYLRPRTNLFSAAFRVRSEVAYAIHSFFHDRGFVYVHTPVITASDCEGAGEMFRVSTLDPLHPPLTEDGAVDWRQDFFGREAGLTVSGQLEGETFALAFGNIYTFGPTFRAENSNTARHAAEFWMIEPEIAFADLTDNMELAWDMIQHIVRHVLTHCDKELAFFNQFVDQTVLARLQALVSGGYEKVEYTQAIEILQKSGADFKYPVFWGCDLQTEHERYLTEQVFQKPLFVINYPKDIKAFYMRMNDDGKTVAAMDLLVPGVGEIIGGSQREERLDKLTARMKEMNLREEDYWWYLNLRRFGGTKHAGYGLGFERILMYLTGISNIRDVIPYPRTTGNAEY